MHSPAIPCWNTFEALEEPIEKACGIIEVFSNWFLLDKVG